MPIGDAAGRAAWWQAQPKANEYGAMENYYKSLGKELGLTPAQAQASAWVGGGKIRLSVRREQAIPALFRGPR